MSAFERNGKYYIRGKLKRDDGSIYDYTKLAKECKGIKEAREYDRQFKKKWQDIQISLKNKTFEELGKEYLDNVKNIKEVTRRTDDDCLTKICKEMGNKRINLITKDYLKNYIKQLEAEYSKSYVSKIYYTIKKVMDYAISCDYIIVNPIINVQRATKKDEIEKEMLFWEPEQFSQFIKYVDRDDLKTLYVFLFYMGCRKGETLALQWRDIDFQNDTVRINKSVTNKIKGQAWAITTPKTGNSIRNIRMPDVVKKALQESKIKQSKCYGFSDDCYVFGYSRPMPQENIRRKLIKYVKLTNESEENEVPLIRIHDFRHSHASYLINNMTDEFTDFDIAKRLGDTVATLHSTYAHWFKQADKGIVDFINKDTSDDEKASEEPKTSKYDELRELKELLDLGIITPDEFTIKKKQILCI